MTRPFHDNKPIFVQIREIIEDQILNDQLQEGEKAPSTNQLVNFYKVNHLTVSKGVTQLVDEGILYKKRGVGMFVAEGAKRKLIEKRREAFMDDYVVNLVQEANKLELSEEEIINLIRNVRGSDQYDV